MNCAKTILAIHLRQKSIKKVMNFLISLPAKFYDSFLSIVFYEYYLLKTNFQQIFKLVYFLLNFSKFGPFHNLDKLVQKNNSNRNVLV